MKSKIFAFVIILTVLALFFSIGSVAAKSKSKRIKAEGCRVTPSLLDGNTTCPGGEPVVGFPFCTGDGRWHVRDSQVLWNIYGGDELVDGTAFFDLNVNCDGPPPGGPDAGHCRMWGSFELIPDAYCSDWGEQWGEPGAEADICTDVSGSWVGTFESIYHDGVWERRIITHGTGVLRGLKLKNYDVIDLGPPGSVCATGGSIPFTWLVFGIH